MASLLGNTQTSGSLAESLYQRALAAYQTCCERGSAKRWMETALTISNLIKASGSMVDPRIIDLRSECWMRANLPHNALDDLELLCKTISDYAIFFKMGRVYEQLNELDGAIIAYEKALNEKKGDTTTLLRLAKCYAKQGVVNKVQEIYAVILKSDVRNIEALQFIRDLCYRSCRYPEAVRCARALLELTPDDPNAYQRCAESYLMNNELDAALDCASAARAQFNSEADCTDCSLFIEFVNILKMAFGDDQSTSSLDTFLRATEFYHNGQFTTAERVFSSFYINEAFTKQAAIRNAISRIHVGVCQFQEKRFEEAERNLFQSLTELNKFNIPFSKGEAYLGWVYEALGNNMMAITAFNCALEIIPKQVDLLLALEKSLETSKNNTQALDLLTEVLKIANEKERDRALFRRAKLYYEEGEFQLSIKDILDLLERDFFNFGLYFLLSLCYSGMGNFLSAEGALETAKKFSPTVAEALNCEHRQQELGYLKRTFANANETSLIRLYGMAEACFYREKWAKALFLLNQLFTLNQRMWSDNPIGIFLFAKCLLQIDLIDSKGAKKPSMDDKDTQSIKQKLAYDYLSLAIQCAERISGLCPAPCFEIYCQMGRYWFEQDKYAEAIPFYRKALTCIPDKTRALDEKRALFEMGYCYLRTNQPSAAFPIFCYLIELGYRLDQACSLKAEALQALNRFEEAYAAFSFAIERGAKWWFNYFRRGQCGEALKKPLSSIHEDFQRAHALASTNELKAKFEAELSRLQAPMSFQNSSSASTTAAASGTTSTAAESTMVTVTEASPIFPSMPFIMNPMSLIEEQSASQNACSASLSQSQQNVTMSIGIQPQVTANTMAAISTASYAATTDSVRVPSVSSLASLSVSTHTSLSASHTASQSATVWTSLPKTHPNVPTDGFLVPPSTGRFKVRHIVISSRNRNNSSASASVGTLSSRNAAAATGHGAPAAMKIDST